MSWLIIIAIIAVLAFLGPRFGADSRDAKNWSPRRSDSPERLPEGPARAVAAH